MGRLLLAGSICAALAACATQYEWIRPETTPEKREADIMACGSRTSHLAPNDVEAVAIVDRCMAARGYEKKRID